ncbi:cytochrome P450 52A12 [Microsporum canis CBS 113480]|uniref:Cytochrome P450 52A12 n=1 Tax=Arthroderma otae (strain ATCC MYA-4605 / CBS 113480) TaxID=554155 RepID=C5FGN3_ARTOC|nr:cytochrome P450 52A12 [Microsporum canis CBS 113480]EEQ29918.1 cytochrome P450 52A12 [Microsporum canis CBS 113480]
MGCERTNASLKQPAQEDLWSDKEKVNPLNLDLWTAIEHFESKKVRLQEKTKPIPKIAQSPVKFGIDFYNRVSKAVEENRYLDLEIELFEKYGDTFSISMFGKTIVMTREPENIKAILATQFEQFSFSASRYNSFLPMLGDGIFTHKYGGGDQGQPWRHSRSVLRPQFARQQIQDLAVLESFVQNMFNLIPDKQTIDLQELFFKLTMDTVCCLTVQLKKLNFTMISLEDLDFYWLQKDGAEFQKICKNMHAYLDKFTRRALQLQTSGKPTHYELGGKYVFLEEAAKEFKDPVRLRSELFNILLAGRDTTASLLSICCHQLARHKDEWFRLRKEVIETLGNRKPTYEDIKSMKYLRYVLNETLRLFPVVPSNGREAVITTTLPCGGGPDGEHKVLVSKGTNVLYSVWGLHRSPKSYGPDPTVFRPSRWESIRVGWNYLPFNGGPRICLGQQYALTEASYVLIRLLQTFEDIENRDPTLNFIEDLRLTMACHGGTKVSLTRASSK